MIMGLLGCLGSAASHLLLAGGSTALCYRPYVVLRQPCILFWGN